VLPTHPIQYAMARYPIPFTSYRSFIHAYKAKAPTNPMATAPTPAKVPAAAPVFWAGVAEPVGEPEGVREALPVRPDVAAAEAPADPVAVGRLDRETPAAAQRPDEADSISKRIVNTPTTHCLVRNDVLARSSALHREGAHWRSDSAILEAPVVHWHLMSERPQPEPWMAVAKQGIYSFVISTHVLDFYPIPGLEMKTYSTAGDVAQILCSNKGKRSRKSNNGGGRETHV
jgi:hypothetical protein